MKAKVYHYNVLKCECNSEREAFSYILDHQKESMYTAVLEDGWDVEIWDGDEIVTLLSNEYKANNPHWT